MWYVNTEKEIEEIRRLHKFYINYVICKFLISFKLVPFKLCFILTMWYVNGLTTKHQACFCFLFYINYVICKWGYKNNTKLGIHRFYINYVICKCMVAKISLKWLNSFILTMWYVNSTVSLASLFAYIVLY